MDNRIPPAILIKIKDTISVPEIIGEKVRLIKKGKVWKGLCPFHDDRNPSFTVHDDSGRWRCWSCGESGDLFDWLSRSEGLDFREAVRYLARRSGIEIPVDEEIRENLQNLKALRRALHTAQDVYAHGLKKSLSATSFLADRGITEKSVADWQLGAVSTGIIPVLLRQYHYSEDILLQSGLAGKRDDGGLYDRLRQRIIIPIHSRTGGLVGFAGRRVNEWDSSPKYLNPPQTPLFNKSALLFGLHRAIKAIKAQSSVVVVEGYFDVIALHQEGERRAVAGMGTAITDAQLALLCGMTNTLFFCLDADNGGRSGIRHLLPRLLNIIEDKHQVFFSFIPDNLDPDDFIRQHGYKNWLQQLGNSIPLSEMLFRYITSNFETKTVEQQQRAALRAEKVIQSVNRAPYLRQLITNQIKKEFGITLSEVLHEPE